VLAVRDLARTAATYETLGFTLTPRAAHEDRTGTSNRLAQFAERNFIELLEVDVRKSSLPTTLRPNRRFSASVITTAAPLPGRDGLSIPAFVRR